MRITDVTDTIAENNKLQSAFAQLVSQRQLIAVQFDDVSEKDKGQLHYRLAQLDFIINTVEPLTGLLPIPALKRLLAGFKDWFHDKAGQADLQTILQQHRLIWQVGERQLDLTDQGLIYAIMNITPDSFFDGGKYTTTDAVLQHVDEMVEAGASVIEVNGQSTRPGFKEVSPGVEIERTIPYIEAIKTRYPEVLVAIDTYKPEVMMAALNAGVDIVNDINGFMDDPVKLTLMAHSSVGLVSMLNMRQQDFRVLTPEMQDYFTDSLSELTLMGVDRERIALDPGVGFSNVADAAVDYPMMRSLEWFNEFKRPLVIAISRKGYLGKLLGLAKEDRLPMTLVNEALMMWQGGRILRVHDVLATKQLVTMMQRLQDGYWTPDQD